MFYWFCYFSPQGNILCVMNSIYSWKIKGIFHSSFFQDGLKTADKLKQYIEKLAADLYNVSLLTSSFISENENILFYMYILSITTRIYISFASYKWEVCYLKLNMARWRKGILTVKLHMQFLGLLGKVAFILLLIQSYIKIKLLLSVNIGISLYY